MSKLTRSSIFSVCLLLIPFAIHAATHEVAVGDNFFSPNDLTIEVGDTVRWTYNGGRSHDVTADDFSWASETSSSFTYERTFNTAEEVLYHCTVHSSPGQNINTSMNGRLNVTQSGGGNMIPEADFSYDCIDLDCDFTDDSTDADGTVVGWSWDFGDGDLSTAQNPSHGFDADGIYSVGLTVTDDQGAMDTHNRLVTVNAPAPEFLINPGLNDAWFFPTTSGQGFFIIVWDQIGSVFLSWFTYETERPPDDITAILGEAGHRWVTAQGPYDGDTAVLNVYVSSGGVFDAAEPAVGPAELIGTITIVWTDCETGIVSYDFPDLGLTGEVPIQRITLDLVPLCESYQPME